MDGGDDEESWIELGDEEIQIFSICILPKLIAVRVLQIRFLSDRFAWDILWSGAFYCGTIVFVRELRNDDHIFYFYDIVHMVNAGVYD